LKDNEKVLAEQLVWLFSSGPTGVDHGRGESGGINERLALP